MHESKRIKKMMKENEAKIDKSEKLKFKRKLEMKKAKIVLQKVDGKENRLNPNPSEYKDIKIKNELIKDKERAAFEIGTLASLIDVKDEPLFVSSDE